jgi:uncharacterized membrane protein YhaH (DUF805 family)
MILAAIGILFPSAVWAQARHQPGSKAAAEAAAGACAACAGIWSVFIIAIFLLIAVNIAILIWVARDAKARGMDGSVMWVILVAFTGFIGLIVYLFSRPQGILVQCQKCKNNRMQAANKCPHCGNA